MKKLNTKKLTQIGMLSAVSVVLMLIEFPLPFLAPGFYKLDLSEVPVLIGCFSMGPVAGVMIELIKVLLNLVINGTETACVGELANFVVGCAFILPAGLIYRWKHTRQGALIGMLTGTLSLTVFGCLLNAYVMLPAYSAAFHLPVENIVAMGTAINSHINSLLTFVLLAVGPFNLIKGILVSAIVFCIYKKISPILKIGRK